MEGEGLFGGGGRLLEVLQCSILFLFLQLPIDPVFAVGQTSVVCQSLRFHIHVPCLIALITHYARITLSLSEHKGQNKIRQILDMNLKGVYPHGSHGINRVGKLRAVRNVSHSSAACFLRSSLISDSRRASICIVGPLSPRVSSMSMVSRNLFNANMYFSSCVEIGNFLCRTYNLLENESVVSSALSRGRHTLDTRQRRYHTYTYNVRHLMIKQSG